MANSKELSNYADSNTIDRVTTQTVTLDELIRALTKTFPSKYTSSTSKVAVVTETKLRDGTTQQTVTFGKRLQI